jgi:hypothetical protein
MARFSLHTHSHQRNGRMFNFRSTIRAKPAYQPDGPVMLAQGREAEETGLRKLYSIAAWFGRIGQRIGL